MILMPKKIRNLVSRRVFIEYLADCVCVVAPRKFRSNRLNKLAKAGNIPTMSRKDTQPAVKPRKKPKKTGI